MQALEEWSGSGGKLTVPATEVLRKSEHSGLCPVSAWALSCLSIKQNSLR